ncbi:hypothetical protein [Chryseobacterium sp. WLY505]|uniref:terminase small subunit-like protein n=1 Tax=Chryseobacterium sp. WLY505 TaxID=3068892 RepID=UPI002796DD0F|nr:hypothetical protein [Chryseobacterium sp. WLY505]MDQ1855746.1 hypothetical protein [Chryseobacterium sp. WLY505]
MAYTEERKEKIFNKIINLIVDEGKPVRQILKEKWAPSTSTFFDWLEEDEKKAKRYARACEIRADILFEEMHEIAFTPEIGETVEMNQKGGKNGKKEMRKIQGDMLGHRRLKVDTLKWQISKLNPKKYGDKLDVTSGGDKILSAEERAQKIRELKDKLNNNP